MPTRRPYRKSRTGCRTCKARRVKCDETHPTCNNCSKRGTSCIFGPENMAPGPSFPCTPQSGSQEDSQLVRDEEVCGQYQNTPTAASARDYSPYDSSLSPSLLPPRGSSQLLEMRLLHHCTTVTFSTIGSSARDRAIKDAWSNEVFHLALHSGPLNPLLDILLGVSAQHLWLLNHNDKSMASISSLYFERGLKTCNEMMSEINSNYCLLFPCSMVITLKSLLSRFEPGGDVRYETPLPWFRATRGVRVIASASKPWIMASKLSPLLQETLQDIILDHVVDDPIFTPLMASLESNSEPENMQTYASAIQYLSWIYATREGVEDNHALRKKILAFIYWVSPLFMSLLGVRDPRALVITAHFFGLIKGAEEVWFLKGLAEKEILGIRTLVPEDWMWAMEWPLKQIQSPSALPGLPLSFLAF